MKRISFKDLSWPVSEETYRGDSALSYSKLATFFKEGVTIIPHLDDKKNSEPLRFGSLVDCLMTEPETLSDRFYLMEISKPSETIANIVDEVYNQIKQPVQDELSEYKDIILAEVNKVNYYGNLGNDTRIKKVVEAGSDYFNTLKQSGQKIVITKKDMDLANACVSTLKAHPYTKSYFKKDIFDEDIELFYQLKFKTAIEGNIPVRCMLDLVIINHKNKTIQPIDLKTTGYNEHNFNDSFIKWRYDIQACLYTKILHDVTKFTKDFEYFKDFEILPFKFIVINKYSLSPIVWEYPLSFNFYKDTTDAAGNVYKSAEKVLKELDWHLKNGVFNYSKEVADNKGNLILNNLYIK